MKGTLFYVHDPMCSWCWAFKPALDELLELLPASLRVQRVLGGLAADSEEPMPEAMKTMLQQTWEKIQTLVPGTEFNFDFWSINQPRRSTWPACRSVLAAMHQHPRWEVPMISAIQTAYYLQARNPSDTETLVSIAGEIGCDTEQFAEYLHSDAAREELEQHRRLTHQLGVQGFPSLVLRTERNLLLPIIIDYTDPLAMLERIEQVNVA